MGEGGGEDGMDVLLPLLEVWRTPFVRVRGALQACHLRARHCQDGDLLRWGVRPTEVHDQGIRPATRKVPEAYMEKMRNWATKSNVKFGKPSAAGASSDVKVER